MKKSLVILLLSLFTLSLTLAQSSCLTVNSKDTKSYLTEISSINSQLSSCSIQIPSQASSLISSGNILVSISMNDGSTEEFYLTILNLALTSITKGSTTSFTHKVFLSESTLDKILQSSDPTNEILAGINDKSIKIKANSFVGKIKWFFAKFFLPKPASSTITTETPVGKPENCDDTYLPGHKDYANNKALWDSYSAETDNVCQSQFGKGIPSPCVYSVQLSIDGNPYYLCWYEN